MSARSVTIFSCAWREPWLAVRGRTCMARLIAHPGGALVSSGPNHHRDPVAMTIRASRDGGKAWSDGTLLDPRPSAYSCMTALKDGSTGVLCETGGRNAYEALTLARFPLECFLEK